MNTSFRCWAEINLEAMRSNLGTIRSFVPAGVRIIAVVKADAYGHGLLEVARELDRDVDLFGVASLAEARAIRSTGAQAPVLILGPALPEERQAIVDEAFIPTVSNLQEADRICKMRAFRRADPGAFCHRYRDGANWVVGGGSGADFGCDGDYATASDGGILLAFSGGG